MNKKYIGVVVVLVVALGLTGGVFVLKAHKSVPKCLAGNSSTGPSGNERTYMEYAAMETNMKAPAGSNADVRIATYTGSQATGSVKFAPGYGTYNFEVVKDAATPSSSSQLTWKLASSTACKE